MAKNNKKEMDEMARLEAEQAKKLQQESPENFDNDDVEDEPTENEVKLIKKEQTEYIPETAQQAKSKKEFKIVDGFKIIPRENLPFGGAFYPEHWEFAYRCPTVDEIANFSTITEDDQPKIMSTIESLIKTCFVIVDRQNQQEISTGEINDGERLYFFLLLREYYLAGNPIEYSVMSPGEGELVRVAFFADSLVFRQPSDKLLEFFDGRRFTFPVPNSEDVIQFLIPTFNISGRIMRYMIKKYQDANKQSSDGLKEIEAFNKKFMVFAPFLYETGNESVEFLQQKFKKIQKNQELYKAYLHIINNLNLTNEQYINYIISDGSQEEALIKFPGGWKNIFTSKGAHSEFYSFIN